MNKGKEGNGTHKREEKRRERRGERQTRETREKKEIEVFWVWGKEKKSRQIGFL